LKAIQKWEAGSGKLEARFSGTERNPEASYVRAAARP
jgi:hypothetical protein